MVNIFVHRAGKTEQVPSLDKEWLNPSSGVIVWVDLAAPSIPERLILSDTFAFHPLSVEDATAALHYPKIEAYDDYLYVILHGIAFHAKTKEFDTHDVDFFVGPNYLVTVHDGDSRSILELKDHVCRNRKILAEGPISLLHRIVHTMVDHYRPEVDKLEERLDAMEHEVFTRPSTRLVRKILDRKKEIASLRRVVIPQRDVVGRLARREFADITTDMSFRFRDIYDHLVRISDDAIVLHDRATSLLDAHLSNSSNRLNEVMKVLTVFSTIFMPLTLLSGLWGMNIDLPFFPGGKATQFWWVAGVMIAVSVGMLAFFRRRHWI
jgi:magnesium transporter